MDDAENAGAGRASGADGTGAGDESDAPGGWMVYHLFASEERRRIVSIFLDNHAVAFSAPAISSATEMTSVTATETLKALKTVGFLVAMDSNEAYQMAASEDAALERVAGDLDEDSTFYRLDKDSELAMALAKADTAASRHAEAFFEAAPDIDRD